MAQNIELTVTGMTCDHCVRAVTNAISESDGVAPGSVQVLLEKGKASFAGEGFDIDKIIEAIDEEGYTAAVSDN